MPSARDGVFDAELAEPPISEVYLHFTTDQPLRARIAKTYPTTSIRIISSGSIDGRPINE
jgi:hypothetical protein